MKRIVFKKVGDVKVSNYELERPDSRNFRLRHLYSLISSGTEILCLTGKTGEFSNVIPGYSAVGELIDGYEDSPFKKGDLLFTNGAHTEIIDIPRDTSSEILMPIDREHLMEATFLPLGKVALHGLRRVNVQLGDWVVVYGLGIVGNLAAQLAKVATGGKVIAVDPIKSRRDIVESLGITTLNPKNDSYIEKVKNFIASGGLGRVLVIDTYIKLWRESDYYTSSSWHGKLNMDGGGPFIQQGSHYIDLAIWLGSGFRRVVSSSLFTLLHPIEVEDHGYSVVEFGDGAIGMIQASTICKGNDVFNSTIEISGTKSSIVLGDKGILGWDVEGCDKPQITYTGDVFDKQFIDFADAVENNREPFINGESAKVSIELIHEIYNKAKISNN